MEKSESQEFDFVKEYTILKDKYGLPELEKLAEDFDIEKLHEKESQFLLREIRRTIVDKVSSYLNLFEILINPSAPPMFVLMALKSSEEKDKEKNKQVYKKIAKIQIKAMRLDTVYSEESEAKFIKDAYNEWQELKQVISTIFESFEENFTKDNGTKKSAYFN